MTASHRRLQDAERQVSAFARAVALKRATVTGVAGFGLAYAVQRGWITPDLSAAGADLVADLLGLATLIGAGTWIHRGTTPADSALQPVNSDGVPLVPDPAIAAAVLEEVEDPHLADAVTRSLGADHLGDRPTPPDHRSRHPPTQALDRSGPGLSLCHRKEPPQCLTRRAVSPRS